jgi:hypothetical protein
MKSNIIKILLIKNMKTVTERNDKENQLCDRDHNLIETANRL